LVPEYIGKRAKKWAVNTQFQGGDGRLEAAGEMRKLVVISIAVFAVISLTLTALAFAEETKIMISDKKVKKIEEKGAFLGVYMDDLDKELIEKYDYPKSSGILIVGIVDDSPADEAGIEDYDIIYMVAGDKVTGTKQFSELIRSKEPGEEISIIAYRDGEKMSFDVELAEKKTAYVTIDIDDDEMEHAKKVYLKALGKAGKTWSITGDDIDVWMKSGLGGRGRLGLKLQELDEDLAEYFDRDAGEGVLILGVVEDSPAEDAGIKSGDVLVEIGDDEISDIKDVFNSLDDIFDDLDDIDEEVEIAIKVVRKGKEMTFDIELEDEFYIGHFGHADNLGKHKELKIHSPKFKEFEFRSIEEREMEKKIEELEKTIEKLEKRMKEIEKED
jgi:C-terminal processing protease CtpA/Prc